MTKVNRSFLSLVVKRESKVRRRIYKHLSNDELERMEALVCFGIPCLLEKSGNYVNQETKHVFDQIECDVLEEKRCRGCRKRK